MNLVLKGVKLDLQFTIYKCLAFNYKFIKPDKHEGDGLMEFVEGSITIQKARKTNSDKVAFVTTKIHTEVEKANILDNYLKSCAGYAVATYLLAIGDRHLENLMITP